MANNMNPIVWGGGRQVPRYSSSENIPANQSYTCPRDGWVHIVRYASNSSTDGASISIAGGTFLSAPKDSQGGGLLIPVLKGDVFSTVNMLANVTRIVFRDWR